MSHSMSPPAQKPLPYPSWNTAGSPGAQSPYGAPPPAKRPRLSPDARSPNGIPNYTNSPHGLPTPGYGNPYAQQQGVQSPYSPSSYAASPQNSFNTPQPYQQQHLPWAVQPPLQQQRPSQTSPQPPASSRDMPPPPRPNKEDEKAGIDDINDSLFMSGINLKDEESYLHNTWNNSHVNDSFATNNSTSFGSSTIGSNNSFNMLTQGTSFGSQGAGAFSSSMGQPRSQESIEEEAKKKREMAARAKAERNQLHLNNQFLQGNCVRNRMHRLATDNAVRLDVQGVYLRNPEDPSTKVMVNGSANEGIVEVKPESMIEAGAAYEHILSLLSIATGERLRGLVDEAYGLARARKYGDHGRVVPPEFADIAVGEGKKSQESVIPESVTGTQWDSQDAAVNGAKEDGQTNGEEEASQPVQTVSFQGALNARLRELADRDREAEKERIKKREARKRKAENEAGEETTPNGTPADTPAATTAEAAPAAKLTKKEATKKQKEEKTAEVQSLRSSNATASILMGGKRNRYSWMSGGGDTGPTNRFLKSGANSGTATPKAQPDAQSAAKAAKEKEIKVPTWGDWREDSVDGKGIQLRDWVLVLEKDGREKKALQKAVNRLS